ncbi:MAG: molecular chaperone DnaJ [Pseudomonadota bacterium]|nr:molecular chaperone DnaJ [Pseudomonadota bacterium]
MSTAPSRRLQALAVDAPPSSPEQQAFDTLHRRIDAQRALLADWQAAIDAYEQRYAREVLPLLAQYRGLHIELLDRLDHAASGGLRLGRTDARALHELIVDIADSLLLGEDDAERRAALHGLRERYADAPELPEAPPTAADDPDALLRHLEAQREAAEAARAAQRAAHRREAAARKKQRAPEAVEASQSLRAVYRQLVSALHPDRESDPEERQRKTVLMQHVNEAYAAQRLTDLLQLQQSIAEADTRRDAQAGVLPADRLAAYNRLLADQLAAVQRQVRELEADFKARHRLNPHGRLKPGTLGEHLRVEQAKLTNGIREMQREARLLDDPAYLKQWVKAQRRMARQHGDDD